MPVPTSNPQDTQAAIAVLIIIGSFLCARYWRAVLLAVVIAAIALTVYGAVISLDAVAALLGAHHR